jgi:hypothetical protein
LHVFLLVIGVEQSLHNDNSTRSIKHMHSLVVLIAGLNLDSCVHFRSGGSTNEERHIDSSLSELFGVENHLI